uniref:Beta-defensin n=1 Tax=Ornithorhynchus anatinus TaxID=9258 RepID=A0A6I8NY01_ORNAN
QYHKKEACVLLGVWNPPAAPLRAQPLSFLWKFRKCQRNGVCRFSCRKTEMLLSFCDGGLECCAPGFPWG